MHVFIVKYQRYVYSKIESNKREIEPLNVNDLM